MRDLVIVGCGGFGREVADVVEAMNHSSPAWNLLGFVDDDPAEDDLVRLQRRGISFLGAPSVIPGGVHYVVGIGNGSTRARVAQRLTESGLFPAEPLIHPRATIGGDVNIGRGGVICAGARLTTNISVGEHCHINLNSTVGHDSIIEDYVTVNPLVAISGNCRIGREANLGTHSSVLPGVLVGRQAVVGAAACVTKDVPNGLTVKGVPAR